MGVFKRLVLFVYAVAGILCLAALALPWFGLFEPQTNLLLQTSWYLTAVEVCLAITGLGLLVTLVRALGSRRRRSIEVMTLDGGSVTVTRDAVASQAAHIVEQDGRSAADDVLVRSGRRGPVRVTVKVRPFESLEVAREAPILHRALVEGLGAMCGDRLGEVSIQYLEPQRTGPIGGEVAADGDVARDGDVSVPVGIAPVAAPYGSDGADEDDYAAPAPVPAATPADAGTDAERQADPAETAPQEASAQDDEAPADASDAPSPSASGDITIPMHAERED